MSAGTQHLETSTGTRIDARAVIIAAGVGAFGPNRPPLERLAEFEGKSIFYLVKRKEDLRGKRVVIAGGGDSALDWTLALAGIAITRGLGLKPWSLALTDTSRSV